MKQAEETGRVETAAMSEAGANDVIVVGRDRLQHMQHRDGIIQHLVGAADQAAGVGEVAGLDQMRARVQFPGNALQQKFGTLVDDLERHLIFVQKFVGGLLQRQKFVGAQVALVVGIAFARQNRFFQVVFFQVVFFQGGESIV